MYVPEKKVKLSIPNNLPDDADENIEVSYNNNLFHEIANYENLSSIIKWPFTLSDSSNDVNERSYNFVSFYCGDSFPIVEKAIKVSNSGTITFGIFGKEVCNTVLNITPGENISSFAENIKEFEKINVCYGGPRAEEFPNFSSNSLYTKSITGRLKHNQCLHVVKIGSTSCLRCARLRNLLNMQKLRINSSRKKLIQVSPTKTNTIKNLRRVKNNLQKNFIRAKQKVNDLKLELSNVQIEMSKLSDCSIKEKIDQCENMNESQKTLILECFTASKVKNIKNRRYSDNWLMLCLLFNIRSPSAYKYLRNSALLPLPHPKTVRRHLSLVKSTCGFDKDFLKILSKKVDKMNNKEKHGILLFDSINLRKSIHVNSSNLTYSGLEDYGDDVLNSGHKEYADHALVFMFQSLGSNFYQTIGCFASKSEVKGKQFIKKNTFTIM